MTIARESQLPESWQTERLLMRPPVVEDAEEVFATYSSDPEVTRYLSFKCVDDVAPTREFLEKVAIPSSKDRCSSAFYFITAKDTGAIMGAISARLEGVRAELGYVLARKHWNNGYMSEVVAGHISLLFKIETVHRVQAYHDVHNPSSGRVMEKAGMQCEGLLRSYSIHPNVSDEPRDCYMWSIVRKDLQNK